MLRPLRREHRLGSRLFDSRLFFLPSLPPTGPQIVPIDVPQEAPPRGPEVEVPTSTPLPEFSPGAPAEVPDRGGSEIGFPR